MLSSHSVGIYRGKRAHTQLFQEHLTDPGLKRGISVSELISNTHARARTYAHMGGGGWGVEAEEEKEKQIKTSVEKTRTESY